MFVMYAILLAAAIHNTVRFVFTNGRYKNFHIASFYLLVFLVILIRVAFYSIILALVVNY